MDIRIGGFDTAKFAFTQAAIINKIGYGDNYDKRNKIKAYGSAG